MTLLVYTNLFSQVVQQEYSKYVGTLFLYASGHFLSRTGTDTICELFCIYFRCCVIVVMTR